MRCGRRRLGAVSPLARKPQCQPTPAGPLCNLRPSSTARRAQRQSGADREAHAHEKVDLRLLQKLARMVGVVFQKKNPRLCFTRRAQRRGGASSSPVFPLFSCPPPLWRRLERRPDSCAARLAAAAGCASSVGLFAADNAAMVAAQFGLSQVPVAILFPLTRCLRPHVPLSYLHVAARHTRGHVGLCGRGLCGAEQPHCGRQQGKIDGQGEGAARGGHC